MRRATLRGLSDDLHYANVDGVDIGESYEPYTITFAVGPLRVKVSMRFENGWETHVEVKGATEVLVEGGNLGRRS